MTSNYDTAARKRPVNLTLNEDHVHRNTGKHKDTIPFVVIVQSA